MKKNILSFIFLLATFTYCTKDEVLSSSDLLQVKENEECENVVLNNQSQVNYFSCNKIEGDLTIDLNHSSGLVGIIDLFPLRILSEIKGDLTIKSTKTVPTSLKDFEGLHNIKEVGGNFVTTVGMDFKGLRGLVNVGGDFSISGKNFQNTLEIADLPNLKNIGGNFSISNITKIHLEGFNNLKHIGGHLSLSIDNSGIINGFNKLTTVTERIYFNNFEKIQGFNSIEEVEKIQLSLVKELDGFLSIEKIDELIVTVSNVTCSELCVFFDKAKVYNIMNIEPSTGCKTVRDFFETCRI